MAKIKITKKNAEYQILEAMKNNRRKRKEFGEIFVEGIESIKQVLYSKYEISRIIYKDYRSLSNWAKERIEETGNAKQIEISSELFKELCDKESPSEIVVTVKFIVPKLSDINFSKKPLILILDRPSDKGNLGTLIRTSNGLKIDAIVVIGHSVDITDPKVIRTSLGALFYTPVAQAESYEELNRWLESVNKSYGLTIAGTDSTGAVSLPDFRTDNAVAIALGNEAKGISKRLKDICDMVISIPIDGQINSLNVACAGSIILWHVRSFM